MPKPDWGNTRQLAGNNAYLGKLIFDILNLEFRIDHQDTDSWYFKSGLASQKVRLGVLITEFETLRATINSISPSELIASLKIEKKKLSEVDILNCSRKSKVIARSISRNRVNTIELYQSIKRAVSDIPDLDYYRQ